MTFGDFIKLVVTNFDVLAGPVISLLYPLYASILAIESKSPVDDQQWLTYWVLYSMITLVELTFAKVIEWLPFWSYAKFFATCWLVLPYFSGAAYVYEHFVRPMFVSSQTVNVWYVPWGKKDGLQKKEDILTAAEKYIQENGPEAFENLLSSSKRDMRPRQSKKGVYFSEDHSESVWWGRTPSVVQFLGFLSVGMIKCSESDVMFI